MTLPHFLIIISLLIPVTSFSASRCLNLFNAQPQIESIQLRFNQNFLGHKWSEFKLRELKDEFNNSSFKKNQKQEFLIAKTKAKPLLVIRDTLGNYRLIDNNHSFYTFTIFMGSKSIPFNIHVKVVKDYTLTKPDGSVWQNSDMMKDLNEKKWTHFYDKENITLFDLLKLPINILSIQDLPERSLMGFVFRELETPLKGSDFTPMIQLRLADKLRELNLEPMSKKTFSQKNKNRIRNMILSNEEVITFLIENLNPSLNEKRHSHVITFLESSLLKIKTQN